MTVDFNDLKNNYYIQNFKNNKPTNKISFKEKINNKYEIFSPIDANLYLDSLDSSLEIAMRLNQYNFENQPNYNALFIGTNLNIEKIKMELKKIDKFKKEIIVVTQLVNIPYVVKNYMIIEHLSQLMINYGIPENKYDNFINLVEKIINNDEVISGFRFENANDLSIEIKKEILVYYNKTESKKITHYNDITSIYFKNNEYLFDLFYYVLTIKNLKNTFDNQKHYIFNFNDKKDKIITTNAARAFENSFSISSDQTRFLVYENKNIKDSAIDFKSNNLVVKKNMFKSMIFVDFNDFVIYGFSLRPSSGVVSVLTNSFLNNIDNKNPLHTTFINIMIANSYLKISQNPKTEFSRFVFNPNNKMKLHKDEKPFYFCNKKSTLKKILQFFRA